MRHLPAPPDASPRTGIVADTSVVRALCGALHRDVGTEEPLCEACAAREALARLGAPGFKACGACGGRGLLPAIKGGTTNCFACGGGGVLEAPKHSW